MVMVVEIKKKIDIDIDDVAYKLIDEDLDSLINACLNEQDYSLIDLYNKDLLRIEETVLEKALVIIRERMNGNYKEGE